MDDESTSIANNLSDRVQRFQLICVCSWGFFGAYFLLGEHVASSALCTTEALMALGLLFLARNRQHLSTAIVNTNLALATFGLIVESLTSGQAHSSTPWFLGCVGLLAAHQLGLRSALVWTLIAVGGVIVVAHGFPAGYFPVWRNPSVTDKLVQQVGFAIVVMMMSMQAEWSSTEYESRLTFLTSELREQTRFLSLAEEVAGVGHWRFNVASRYVCYSPSISKLFGMETRKQFKEPIDAFLARFPSTDADNLRTVIAMASEHRDFFLLDITIAKNHETRYLTCSGMSDVSDSGDIRSIIGTFRDDTNAKRVQGQLRDKNEALVNLANFDSLTKLPNRHFFREQLGKSIALAKRKGTMSALLLMDIDGFKGINDTMGHASGDAILKEISERLRHVLRSNDTVARLGGDEFTVILNGIRAVEDVHVVADKIISAVTEPYHLAEKEFDLGASVGAALCPLHADTRDDLLSFADTAMYRAKASGGGLCIYDPAMTVELLNDRLIDSRLAKALENDDFYIDYQPQIATSAHRKEVIGVEALLRWNCDGQIIPPIDFISRLESSEGIVEVGNWVLETACIQAKRWQESGWNGRLAVNISPVQFRADKFKRDVADALEKSGFPATRLELEVTENMLIEDIEDTVVRLNELKEMGISISIDDFGTGYCSLGYLKHLPVDRLKIDRTFVRDIPESDDGTLISSIIMLAHNLGVGVIAEGVESEEQLAILQRLGCNEFQGFLFSRPLSAEDLEKKIRFTSNFESPVS